jgi:hypothetical protein
MARRLFIVKLDETIVPEGEDLDAYYDQRATDAIGVPLVTDVAYVRAQIGLTTLAIDSTSANRDIVAYAVGESGNDILAVIKGIGQAAAGSKAVTISEITE